MSTPDATPTRSRVGVVVAALVIVLACAGLASLAAAIRDTTWRGTAQVVLGAESSDEVLGTGDVDQQTDRTLATQAELVSGDTVIDAASAKLGTTATKLRDAVTVDTTPESNVLTISATADSAEDAATWAQTVADEYVAAARDDARQRVQARADALDSPIAGLREALDATPRRGRVATSAALTTLVQQKLQLTSAAGSETGPARVVTQARTPRSPSSISPATAAAIGAGIGLVIAAGLLLLAGYGRREPA